MADSPRRSSAGPSLTIVWFREDLRLADNPAVHAATVGNAPVICLFVLEDAPGLRERGGASRWWLHHSLQALSDDLRSRGGALVLRRGAARDLLPSLAAESGATAVMWNRRYGGVERAIDEAVEARLRAQGVKLETFSGKLLLDPTELRTKTGGVYHVFTPFWRAAQAALAEPGVLPIPARIHSLEMQGDALANWRLLPARPDWAGGLREAWKPGESSAAVRLRAFLSSGLSRYAAERDIPAVDASTRLSPHLAFGELGPGQIWYAVNTATRSTASENATKLRSEIGWREFAWHLMAESPEIATRNLNSDFDAFPWAEPDNGLKAWRQGRTGYPIVDAAMRQLWRTGWMHNRLRLVAASFLVKHLLIDWRHGESWFWDTLVDADAASNAMNWQWVAGSGVDAAPYFRIFNPVLQGRKFDPDGTFVRHYVPEIAGLPARHIHEPWRAPQSVLDAANIRLGATYPAPIVAHDFARRRALAALATMRSRRVDGPVKKIVGDVGG